MKNTIGKKISAAIPRENIFNGLIPVFTLIAAVGAAVILLTAAMFLYVRGGRSQNL